MKFHPATPYRRQVRHDIKAVADGRNRQQSLGLFISDLIVFTDFNIESRSDVRERTEANQYRNAKRFESWFMEIDDEIGHF